jgi:hypothetical protein
MTFMVFLSLQEACLLVVKKPGIVLSLVQKVRSVYIKYPGISGWPERNL